MKAMYRRFHGYLSTCRRQGIAASRAIRRFIKTQPKKYDVFISLGRNCEFSFQFQNEFAWLESNLFAWAAILNQDKFIQCLKNIDDLFTGEIREKPPVNMWVCAKYEIAFHGRSHPSMLVGDNGKRDLDKVKSEKLEVLSRVNYLKSKHKKMLKSKQKKLFVVTVNWDVLGVNTVREIRSILESATCKFDLLVIYQKSTCPPNAEKLENFDNVHVRFLDHFAPYDNVTDIEKSDRVGWKKIFTEFRPYVTTRKSKTAQHKWSANRPGPFSAR